MSSIEKKVNKFLIGAVLGGGIAGMGQKTSKSDSSTSSQPSQTIATSPKQVPSGLFAKVYDFFSLGVKELFKSKNPN